MPIGLSGSTMPCKQRKIVILGYRSVGKSSLAVQFVDHQFADAYNPTIEYTFTKSFRLRGEEYELTLVDTAGQDNYSIFPAQYSMDCHGYLLVYSVTSLISFEVVRIIHEKLLDTTGKVSVPIVLVGNKKDLYLERTIHRETGMALAAKWNVPFRETSAKANESVEEVFRTVLIEIERFNGNIPTKSRCSVA